MAEITAAMVQELREATNVGMMECKRALTEAGGDKEKAVKILRERGMAIAVKKAARTANQGLIAAATAADGRTAALIEINCETDFAAKNEKFQKLAADLASKALGLADNAIGDATRAEVTALVAAIGENIVAKRNMRYILQGEGVLVTYIHPGGKLGVMLELGCTKKASADAATCRELARDIALHIAACSPPYLARQEVPAAVIASEREIYAKQVTNKPPQIIEKIVDGKLGKYYSQVCLLEQPFVKEQAVTIAKLLEAKAKELGDTLTIRRFVRFMRGE